VIENPKITLFLRGTSCSQVVQLALADLNSLKRPLAIKFNKKNSLHPFDDPSSLEFFSEKNDTSLMVFGHHSKKRPHCITVVRCFNAKILEMLELYIDPESFRTMNQFKNKKCGVGLKPLIAFSGTAFEGPTTNTYTLAKSLLLDLFRGQEVASVDVEGLQYLIHISAAEETDGQPPPTINLRVYLLRTKKSGQKTPRVELEEMGPRIDFRIGRAREAEPAIMKEALKKPKQLEVYKHKHMGHCYMLTSRQPKPKKNIDTDLVGDKVGRIHIGKQNLGNLQTRKIKGLKRSHSEMDPDDISIDNEDGHEASRSRKK
jgi:ribosome production factor 2